MPFYRVIFVNNTIMSCEEDDAVQLKGKDLHYVQDKGKLIFAYIKADTLVAAAKRAADLVAEVTKPNK
ncbi:MAG: hypothetical protein EOP56_07110 [Sphingobacteriales bacterium]|nr:MAG: hypothetical protein EOP56_07110 [Sphingobacteriales bacterium]